MTRNISQLTVVSGHYMTDRQLVHQDVYFIPLTMMMMMMMMMMTIILLLYPRVYIVDVLAVRMPDLCVLSVKTPVKMNKIAFFSCDIGFDPLTLMYEYIF